MGQRPGMSPEAVGLTSSAAGVQHWTVVAWDDQRIQYFLRVDPPSDEGEPLRVPPDVRERVLEGLRHRFDPKPRDYWEAIDITTLKIRGTSDFDRVNAEAHRRLGSILDQIEPRWRQHHVLIPEVRQPHRLP